MDADEIEERVGRAEGRAAEEHRLAADEADKAVTEETKEALGGPNAPHHRRAAAVHRAAAQMHHDAAALHEQHAHHLRALASE